MKATPEVMLKEREEWMEGGKKGKTPPHKQREKGGGERERERALELPKD